MRHRICHIDAIERVGTYVLRLRFDDGLTRTIDFEPVLAGELFGPLRDPDLFARVSLDKEVRTIVWPTGADFVRQRCTTGQSTNRRSDLLPSAGVSSVPWRNESLQRMAR